MAVLWYGPAMPRTEAKVLLQVPGHPDIQLTGVEISWEEEKGEWSPAHWSVFPVWSGVDRPSPSGWSAGKNRKLADRLAVAVIAGVALADLEVRIDVNNQTYVSARHVVSARCLNADLRRLGF